MRILCLLFSICLLTGCQPKKDKTVLLSISAKNKEHVLSRCLECVKNFDYDKKAITLHFLTGCNEDGTEEVLQKWIDKNGKNYKEVLFETTDDPQFDQDLHSAVYKESVLKRALETGTDFCFIVAPISFLSKSSLRHLIEKDLPVVAPMLRAIPEPNDNNTNFFADVSEHGYYKDHPDYQCILNQEKVGTFPVPVIHCSYLIRSDALPGLSYLNETPDFEFIAFGRCARSHDIQQYICNEEEFGVYVHFHGEPSLEEQKKRLQYIMKLPHR